MLFTDLKSSKQFLRNSKSKSEATIGSLLEALTKTAKKDYFNKNLSSKFFFNALSRTYLESLVANKLKKNKILNLNKKKTTVSNCENIYLLNPP